MIFLKACLEERFVSCLRIKKSMVIDMPSLEKFKKSRKVMVCLYGEPSFGQPSK